MDYPLVLFLLIPELLTFLPADGALVREQRVLTVRQGRNAFLHPLDLMVDVPEGAACRIEVDTYNPMSQRVGYLEPNVFDCHFPPYTVQYVHDGNPMLEEDLVRLNIYYFLPSETITDTLLFRVLIVKSPYDIFVDDPRLRTLEVKNMNGFSNPIDSTVLQFKYNYYNGASCKLYYTQINTNLPGAGQLVKVHNSGFVEQMNSIWQDCREFLLDGLQYEHLKPPSPTIDYLPLTVEVEDPLQGEDAIKERMYLPVKLLGASENTPPTISIAEGYVLEIDQILPTALDPEAIKVDDVETPPADLVYNVTSPTDVKLNQGYLIHADDSHTKPIYSFFQHDLDRYRILYQPPIIMSPEEKIMQMEFVLSDMHFATSKPAILNISVKPKLTRAPQVVINRGLILIEGECRPITDEHMKVLDEDPDRVEINVRGGSRHGQVEVDGVASYAFSPDLLTRGKVRYCHDDSDTSQDRISFRITDGTHNTRVKLLITILPKADSAPYLIKNDGLKVKEGDYVQITDDFLMAHDKDSDDSHIVYILKTPPVGGELVKRHQPMRPGQTITKFTQLEMTRGHIYYRHIGGPTYNDSFEFRVSDDSDPPNKSGKYTVDIQIAPNKMRPPQQVEGTKRQITVKETEIAHIGKENLWYRDAQQPKGDPIYVITSQPYFLTTSITIDAGRIISTENITVLKKDSSIPALHSFFQSDLNAGRVAYMPPVEDIGSIYRSAQFVFTVSDAAGNRLMDQTFDITIVPVNNQVPHLSVSPLNVQEGGTVQIHPSDVTAYDPDTEQDELIFTLEHEPKYGTLQKDDIRLVQGEQFSMLDLTVANIWYGHDGSEYTEDSFSLSVTDGMHKFTKVVQVHISPPQSHPPLPLPNLKKAIQVPEGGEVIITKANLAATDNDTDDMMLQFRILKSPEYGELQVGGKPTKGFSQSDLWKDIVKYQHTSGEIGPNPRLDSVTFVVADRTLPDEVSSPLLDLNITITPEDNTMPELILGGPLFVQEGQKAPITFELIAARDLDTPVDKLWFVITKDPKAGHVLNTKLFDQETGNYDSITSFTMTDIMDGIVMYSHGNATRNDLIMDTFYVYVTDGIQKSPSEQVDVTIISHGDAFPTIEIGDLVVHEGSEKIFSVHLTADATVENKDQLRLGVANPPRHGKLSLIQNSIAEGLVEIPLHDIPIDDMDHELQLVYQHDGSETTEDQFTLIINDGTYVARATPKVKIIPVNDEIPQVFKKTGISVEFGREALITAEQLQALDDDNEDSEVFYILLSEPRKGLVQFLPKGSELRQQELEAWIQLQVGSNFTQDDVNFNRVRYIHTGFIGDSATDKFDYMLADGANELPKETFKIDILGAEPNQIVLINEGMHVKEGGDSIITSDKLSAKDANTAPTDIVFIITSLPIHGHIGYMDDKTVPISRFTQQELIEKKVFYTHTDKEDIPEDSFQFSVVSGQNHSKSGKFTIQVDTVDHSPPSLINNVPITVVQGDKALITQANLLVTDPDTPATNITYLVVGPLSHGTFFVNRNAIDTFDGNFTQHDINQGLLTYQSASSDDSGVDFCLFQITDNHNKGYLVNGTAQTSPVFFNILIQPLSKRPPRIMRNQSPKILESLGNSKIGFVITGDHLRAEHPDFQSQDIMYTIKEKPLHGYLEHLGTRRPIKRKFTQKDLDDGRVAFIMDEHTLATNDTFAFRVADLNRNTLDDQRFYFSWSSIEFHQYMYIVCEDAGIVSIDIIRHGNVNESATVEIKHKGMSAKAFEDYTPSDISEILFDPGQTRVQWDVEIRDDGEEESSEKFKVMLRNPVNAMIGENDKTVLQIINFQDGSCAEYIGMITKSQPKRPLINGGEHSQEKESPNSLERDQSEVEEFGAELGLGLDLDGIDLDSWTEEHRDLDADLGFGGNQDWTLNPKGNRDRDDEDYRKPAKKHKKGKKKNKGDKRNDLKKDTLEVSTAMDGFDASSPTPRPNGVAPQPCTRDTRGLLYFDLYSSKMYRCSGTVWERWGWGPSYQHTSMLQDASKEMDREEADSKRREKRKKRRERRKKGRKKCLQGWSKYQDECFQLMPDKDSWEGAEKQCQKLDGHLMSIDSAKHLMWSWKLAEQEPFWIGLNDKKYAGMWENVNGNGVRFYRWKGGFPKIQRTKNCVLVSKRAEWVNRPCDSMTARFICSQPMKSRRKRHHKRGAFG